MSLMITLEKALLDAAPLYAGVALKCAVNNGTTPDELWLELQEVTRKLINQCQLSDIHAIPGIQAMRLLYKRLGKDPNRYRPSAEALCRRIVQGKGLYRINVLVDVINLLSVQTGFSIGGFDADKVVGDLVLGVGTSSDVFHGIGRGLLNIEGLPVYKDALGCIGTPTSDEERTKLSLDTTHLLMIIHSAGGRERLEVAVNHASALLERYANATNIKTVSFPC